VKYITRPKNILTRLPWRVTTPPVPSAAGAPRSSPSSISCISRARSVKRRPPHARSYIKLCMQLTRRRYSASYVTTMACVMCFRLTVTANSHDWAVLTVPSWQSNEPLVKLHESLKIDLSLARHRKRLLLPPTRLKTSLPALCPCTPLETSPPRCSACCLACLASPGTVLSCNVLFAVCSCMNTLSDLHRMTWWSR